MKIRNDVPKKSFKKEREQERHYISQSKTKMNISFPNWLWTMLSILRGRFPFTHENSKYGTPTSLISPNHILLPAYYLWPHRRFKPPGRIMTPPNSLISTSLPLQSQIRLKDHFLHPKTAAAQILGWRWGKKMLALTVSIKSREVFVSSDT